MKTVSNIAGTVRRLLIPNHPDMKLGHGLELVAASLGYKSQSAYKAAVEQGQELDDLSRIRHFLPDLDNALRRAKSLGLDLEPQEAREAITDAWRREVPTLQQYTTEFLLFERLREEFCEAIEEHHDIISIAAEMNHGGGLYANIYLPLEAFHDLDVEFGKVSINVKDDVVMEVDLDRYYNGHRIAVAATFEIERLGKRTLSEASVQVTRAFNRHHVDQTPEDTEPPSKTNFIQALSWLLHIPMADAETLVGCNISPTMGPGSIVYDWVLDFTGVASSRLLSHIEAVCGHQAGAGKVAVPKEFFDNLIQLEGNSTWPIMPPGV